MLKTRRVVDSCQQAALLRRADGLSCGRRSTPDRPDGSVGTARDQRTRRPPSVPVSAVIVTFRNLKIKFCFC